MDLDASSSSHPLSSEPDISSRDTVPTQKAEPMEIEQQNIPNKGKATDTSNTNSTEKQIDQQTFNPIQEELQIEDLAYDDIDEHNQSSTTFSLFTTRDSFPQEWSYTDICLKICETFSIHSGDLTQITTRTIENIVLIIIEFSSKSVYDKYVNKPHDILKVFFGNTIQTLYKQ